MIQDAAVVAETERMLEVEEVVEVEPTGRGGACGVKVKDYFRLHLYRVYSREDALARTPLLRRRGGRAV